MFTVYLLIAVNNILLLLFIGFMNTIKNYSILKLRTCLIFRLFGDGNFETGMAKRK